jgi:hypothetical protein
MGWTSHWIVPSKRRAQPPFVFPAVCRRDLRHPLHNYSSCDLRHPRHKCLTDAAIIIHHYGVNAQETARLNWIVAFASMFKYPCCHGPVARPPAHVDNSISQALASTLLAIRCRFSFPLCFLYSLLKFVDQVALPLEICSPFCLSWLDWFFWIQIWLDSACWSFKLSMERLSSREHQWLLALVKNLSALTLKS